MVKEVNGFWGLEYTSSTKENPTDEDLDFRLELGLDADIGLGYEFLTFWVLREEKNLLVFNPSAFLEVASHSWMTFKLYFIEFTFSMDIIGYRITPLEYQSTWDIDNKKDYCYSVGARQDVFDIAFHVENRVYECMIGFIGLFFNSLTPADDDDTRRTDTTTDAVEGDDFADCMWMRYYPQ